jgi:TonB family protein
MSESEPPPFSVPFLEPEAPSAGDEAAPEAEPPPPPARRFGKGWPFLVAAMLVVGTLIAVYVLLHPRGSGTSADESIPAVVTAESAVLQKGPSAQGGAVATLTQGQAVRVRAESARWVDVEAGGNRGFLPADAVERDRDREARERRARTLLAFAPVYGVVAEDTDVTLAPYPLAARGGRLARGTVIAIHSVDHSYFAFADRKWGIAFVDSSRVDLVPPDPRQPGVTPEKVKPLKNLAIIDLTGEPPPEDEALGDLVEPSLPPSAPPAAAIPPEPAPGLVDAPQVLTRVEPAYTEAARRAGIEGTVELEIVIDATGKVTEVEVARGLPLGLSEAAADAVRRWTWKPARTAAGPVVSRKTVRVRFLLKPAD